MARVLNGMEVDRQYNWITQGRKMYLRVFGSVDSEEFELNYETVFELFHPSRSKDFKDYRMREFVFDKEVFEDRQELDPGEVLLSLEFISEVLIDYKNYVEALPLLTLMNYIATDVVKSEPFMIKARVLKGVALAKLGYIQESLNIFFLIIHNKDKITSSKIN
jgi:hypothetical protein